MGNQWHDQYGMRRGNYQRIVDALEWNGVAPVKTFVAAAGRDYATVEAWEIGVRQYVVKFPLLYFSEQRMYCETASDIDNLDKWLFEYLSYENAYGINLIEARANIYGMNAVETAPADTLTPCIVLRERGARVDVVFRGDGFCESDYIFSSIAEAHSWIDAVNEEDDAGHPTYKIVATQFHEGATVAQPDASQVQLS